MPNANYVRGRAYEYELMRELEASGYDAYRTAGSHGKFDIIAVNPKTGHVKFIQCKTTEDEAEAKRLCSAFRASPPYPAASLPKKVCQIMSVKVMRQGRREAIV